MYQSRKIFQAGMWGMLGLFLLSGCAVSKPPAKPVSVSTRPQAEREFRAAWVATVANINWPSKPNLPVSEQKREALIMLDSLQALHFNAVVFQVRPQCDALYDSKLEPWSYYLTGTQGQAPNPYYDPLQFWIDAAHDRGIELHVWLNPYRAHHKDGKAISEESIVKKRPELVVSLKEGYYWLDPAQKGTQDHSHAVVMDLVNRYDIDGVHFDDYFYPYPSYNGGADFPDSVSWRAYQNQGGKLSRGDWRREAVNTFIERLYRSIKAAKPHVKFGLSPFGIWRPGYPPSVEGFDQYDQLYADAKLWLNKGWVDYFTPQLYWPINRIGQSYPVLLGWWQSENSLQRHLWPGISIGRDTSARNLQEIQSQIMITRGMVPVSPGVVHWNISGLTKNPAMAKVLLDGPYKKQALVPASPWIDAIAPVAPKWEAVIDGNRKLVSWSHPQPSDVWQWVVYFQYGGKWNYYILPAKDRMLLLPLQRGNNNLGDIRITAVDRNGNESN
jgi:uncharacterized lipoprotein YddW (UPF0748 family)